MDLLKDLKFQMALVSLIVAGVLYFMPDVDEQSLIQVVGAIIGVILGGHSVAEYRKRG